VIPAGEGERALLQVTEVAHLAPGGTERATQLLVEARAAHRVDQDADGETVARPAGHELGDPRADLPGLPDVHVHVQAVARRADRLLHRIEDLAVVPPREAIPVEQ
jgi:hypothetical protein